MKINDGTSGKDPGHENDRSGSSSRYRAIKVLDDIIDQVIAGISADPDSYLRNCPGIVPIPGPQDVPDTSGTAKGQHTLFIEGLIAEAQRQGDIGLSRDPAAITQLLLHMFDRLQRSYSGARCMEMLSAMAAEMKSFLRGT